MSTINLADVSKNPKDVQSGIKEWERANDAELIECMQRRGELKHLKAASYNRVRTVLSVREPAKPDAQEGFGFKVGDSVELSEKGCAIASLAGLPQRGVVTGIRDGFVRVGSELYALDMWQRKTKI